MSTTRVKMSNQNSTRNFLRKMRVFKAKHPWITVKPPRNPFQKPKTQRNIPQSMSTRRVKISNQKSIKNFLRAFKASHPWLTIAPPRPKTQRNNISVRKDLLPKDLFEYIEPHQKEIKIETKMEIETKTSRSKVVPPLELGTELDLECQYTGEFGEAGRGYIGTFEFYTKDNPLGHFQGYIAKKDSGEHWREIAECDIFIVPKKEGSTIRIYY